MRLSTHPHKELFWYWKQLIRGWALIRINTVTVSTTPKTHPLVVISGYIETAEP